MAGDVCRDTLPNSGDIHDTAKLSFNSRLVQITNF